MKILFIRGSLEPGFDGVGDYTRRLAGELIKQGHTAAAVSINDRFIRKNVNDTQEVDCVILKVFRVGSVFSEKERFSVVNQFIAEFNPEWISLQFVPFSFHKRGLPFYLPNWLTKLTTPGRKWHIMFHELWVGMSEDATLKAILWGKCQKSIIRSIINITRSSVIHTQSTFYQSQLMEMGAKAGFLPLFSNIPFTENEQLPHDQDKLIIQNNDELNFVVFGGIHSESPIEQFAKEAAKYSKDKDKKIILRFIGRCGKEQERWIALWESEGLSAEVYGQQTTEYVSYILCKSLIGIATTPHALLEKSGSVAAMLEHGLPVIAVSKNWVPKGNASYKTPKGVTLFRGGDFNSCITLKTTYPGIKISKVAAEFVNDLYSERSQCNG